MKLRCKKFSTSSISFMSKQPAPSDSSNPKFIFHARMIARNLVELSDPATSVEQDIEEVVEVESEVE